MEIEKEQLVIILDIAYTHGINNMGEHCWVKERDAIIKKMDK